LQVSQKLRQDSGSSPSPKEASMLKGYRTLLFNLIPILILLGDYVLANGNLISLLITDPTTAAIVVALINMVNIVLRFVTTTPAFKKEEQ